MHKTSTIMTRVVLALIPAIIAKTYFWGIGTLLSILLGLLVAYICEIISSLLRGYTWNSETSNRSAWVTIVILALSLPPALPYYVIITTSICAIVLSKQFYGGMGQNIFNPAMVAMAVFVVSYPQYLGSWYLPSNSWLDLSTQWSIFWWGEIDGQALSNFLEQARNLSLQENAPQDLSTAIDIHASYGIDALTQATPLTEIKGLSHGGGLSADGITELVSQDYWRWFIYVASFVLGGIALIYQKIITWHLPVYTLIGFIGVSLIHYLATGLVIANPLNSVVFGSIVFGAFFVVTDPVSCPQYGWARIVYPVGIGALAYIIRTFTNYNDGVAFAVILMNMLVPFFDQVSRPKEYGK